jgi:hypothetical protein
MKKKMERIGGELFRPLTLTEQVRVNGGITETYVSIAQTHTTTGSDIIRDGDHE